MITTVTTGKIRSIFAAVASCHRNNDISARATSVAPAIDKMMDVQIDISESSLAPNIRFRTEESVSPSLLNRAVVVLCVLLDRSYMLVHSKSS